MPEEREDRRTARRRTGDGEPPSDARPQREARSAQRPPRRQRPVRSAADVGQMTAERRRPTAHASQHDVMRCVRTTSGEPAPVLRARPAGNDGMARRSRRGWRACRTRAPPPVARAQTRIALGWVWNRHRRQSPAGAWPGQRVASVVTRSPGCAGQTGRHTLCPARSAGAECRNRKGRLIAKSKAPA